MDRKKARLKALDEDGGAEEGGGVAAKTSKSVEDAMLDRMTGGAAVNAEERETLAKLARPSPSVEDHGEALPAIEEALNELLGPHPSPSFDTVDDKGVLVYRGALDNAPMNDTSGAPKVNLFEDALAALAAGKPVAEADNKAWGCSVKYAK